MEKLISLLSTKYPPGEQLKENETVQKALEELEIKDDKKFKH